ncbi:MAG TPA: imelysin family protein, partial [Bacteroidia bacterium]|nr:imelysin family protein [Bacteroidia bacterium]
MVRNRFLIPIALLLGLTLVFAGCKEDSDPKEYDRAALTAQVGDRIIRPAYSSLADAVELLRTDCNSFRQNPDLTHHAALADQSKATWLIWKACSPFEFGPAATVSLRSILNTFPSDTLQIHANFTSGSYDLNQAVNLDARGFPALDFLLHGLAATDAEILGRYNNAADSA